MPRSKSRRKSQEHSNITRKEDQIQRRRLKVLPLWLWGFKESEIAQLTKTSRRTIYRDIDEIRRWPESRKATLIELRERIESLLMEILKELKLDLMDVKSPERRILLLRKIAEIPLAMWQKLMPTEIQLEERMTPEIPEDEFDEKTRQMNERVTENHEC